MRYLSASIFLVLSCIPALAEVPPAQPDTVMITHHDTVFVIPRAHIPRMPLERNKSEEYAFSMFLEGAAIGTVVWVIWRTFDGKSVWKQSHENGSEFGKKALLTIALPAAYGALLGAIIGLGEHYPAPISFMPLHHGGMVLLAMEW